MRSARGVGSGSRKSRELLCLGDHVSGTYLRLSTSRRCVDSQTAYRVFESPEGPTTTSSSLLNLKRPVRHRLQEGVDGRPGERPAPPDLLTNEFPAPHILHDHLGCS